jgi:hypothetical protein
MFGQIILVFLGLLIISMTLFSAIRTFILPRASSDPVAQSVFSFYRLIFESAAGLFPKYSQRDRIMAFYAPIVLLTLPPLWLLLLAIGFTFIYYALGITNWGEAFTLSGSSLLTLGFAKSEFQFPFLEFAQATLGPLLIALLISYLPTMYAAFQAREKMVNLLNVRAGSPPSPVQMLMRLHRLNRLNDIKGIWEEWEKWFVELEESHTSLSALVFFRSPQAENSWVNAAGAIMDAAALRLSLLELPEDQAPIPLPDGSEIPRDAQAAITIRAGFIALRRIADFFQVRYNPDPHFPQDPISITHEAFNQAIALFEQQGIPVRKDHQKAWADFAGWRVNYDPVLKALKELTMAPPTSWLGEL